MTFMIRIPLLLLLSAFASSAIVAPQCPCDVVPGVQYIVGADGCPKRGQPCPASSSNLYCLQIGQPCEQCCRLPEPFCDLCKRYSGTPVFKNGGWCCEFPEGSPNGQQACRQYPCMCCNKTCDCPKFEQGALYTVGSDGCPKSTGEHCPNHANDYCLTIGSNCDNCPWCIIQDGQQIPWNDICAKCADSGGVMRFDGRRWCCTAPPGSSFCEAFPCLCCPNIGTCQCAYPATGYIHYVDPAGQVEHIFCPNHADKYCLEVVDDCEKCNWCELPEQFCTLCRNKGGEPVFKGDRWCCEFRDATVEAAVCAEYPCLCCKQACDCPKFEPGALYAAGNSRCPKLTGERCPDHANKYCLDIGRTCDDCPWCELPDISWEDICQKCRDAGGIMRFDGKRWCCTAPPGSPFCEAFPCLCCPNIGTCQCAYPATGYIHYVDPAGQVEHIFCPDHADKYCLEVVDDCEKCNWCTLPEQFCTFCKNKGGDPVFKGDRWCCEFRDAAVEAEVCAAYPCLCCKKCGCADFKPGHTYHLGENNCPVDTGTQCPNYQNVYCFYANVAGCNCEWCKAFKSDDTIYKPEELCNQCTQQGGTITFDGKRWCCKSPPGEVLRICKEVPCFCCGTAVAVPVDTA